MRLKKGDLFIAIILIIAVLGWFTKDTIWADNISRNAVLKVDGQIYTTLTLDSSNEREEIPLHLAGDHFMRIVTEKDQIWVEESTCPDKICVITGKISKPGQSIVCLPTKTIIYIDGKEEMEVDDISI
ncbi:NusG domain II-containing protein [Bacillus sp. B15-48]|uniref:NusG domain II-containing protein n=1 Tax=Bacillus sp. B15-48 TaxID=1548601 RepID=UPI00193EF703|nr:NusG domain II-containing protein [Bacillus sp. B15-48]MBM4763035.1 NusG domain II-containing protein [Bacillus sp. B15-48]